MAKRRKVGNLLALSLLTLLTERPMYPYEMAAALRERGKDNAIKINWGSLYTVVQNLEKHGFIEAVQVAREGRQPERTTYQITDAGRAELKDWLRELLCRLTSSSTCCSSGSTRSRRPTPSTKPGWPCWPARYPGYS
jgi:DNA-binding PadR family transcriptional regulator